MLLTITFKGKFPKCVKENCCKTNDICDEDL